MQDNTLDPASEAARPRSRRARGPARGRARRRHRRGPERANARAGGAGPPAALPQERAIEVLDQPGLDLRPGDRRGAAARSGPCPFSRACRRTGSPTCSASWGAAPLATCWSGSTPRPGPICRRLLAYPEESAGSIMTTEFVSVPSNWTVAPDAASHPQGRAHPRDGLCDLRRRSGRRRRWCRSCPLRRLITGDPHANVLDRRARRASRSRSRPYADREEAARLISKYDLLAVPVVDAQGPCARHRDRRRRDRRHGRRADRRGAEVRRHGGARRALHGDRLSAR